MKKAILIIAAAMFAADYAAGQAPKGYKAGAYEVYILTENSGTGSTALFADTPEDILHRYAPDGTFPNAVNAILIKSEDRVWLVDTGFGRNIFNRMAEAGLYPEDVNCVLITHMHPDHISGMFRDGEKTFPNAEVIVSEKERAFWTSDEEMNRRPESRDNFLLARKVFAEYGDKVKTVEPLSVDDEFPDGITPIAAYGHTPGHTMYLVQDGAERLLIWGDLMHALAIQMPHPEISISFDVDPDASRESRQNVLRRFVSDNSGITAIAGMHLPADYPGVVYRNGETGYRFEELKVEN